MLLFLLPFLLLACVLQPGQVPTEQTSGRHLNPLTPRCPAAALIIIIMMMMMMMMMIMMIMIIIVVIVISIKNNG